MALRRREPLDIALATIKGETEPAEPFVLEQDRVVTIGRTGTIRLLDQLVSIHHARVLFDPSRERYLIEDLGSATGTFVNGECVRGETRDLKLGMELRFGETTLKVQRVARMAWVFPTIGAVAGALTLLALAALCAGMKPAPQKDPLAWPEGILTPQGRISKVSVEDTFRWARGLPLPLELEDVTDFDFDGRDEMWIVDGKREREFVVTFADDGSWIELGLLPADCVVRGDDEAFPIVDCQGEQWEIVADEGEPLPGTYRPVFQEGPVVWYREVPERPAPPPKPKPKAKSKSTKAPPPVHVAPVDPNAGFGVLPKDTPLKVGRYALKDPYQIAQFLSERGVYDPVHYVICEGTFPGIRAQVLTYDGQIQQLEVGCIEELRLEGQISARPFAVAFTPTGLRALVDDVMTFYGGAPDGLFLDPKWHDVAAVLRADPGHYKGVVKLVASTKNAPMQIFDPIARTRLTGVHPLEEIDLMLAPAPIAITVTVPGPGIYDYPTAEGRCETLRVEANSYDAPGWTGSKTLLTVKEVGCGAEQPVLSAGYVNGNIRGVAGQLEVLAAVELEPVVGEDVLRIRLSWR